MSVSPIDGVPSSESQMGKPHLSFVNKGKWDILSFHSTFFFARNSDVLDFITKFAVSWSAFPPSCLQVEGGSLNLGKWTTGGLFVTQTATNFLLVTSLMTLMRASSKTSSWVRLIKSECVWNDFASVTHVSWHVFSTSQHMETLLSSGSTPRELVESFLILDLWCLTTPILCKESWGPR